MTTTAVGIIYEWPSWLLATLGFYVALRIAKFPDLTVEASFVGGSVGMAVGAAYNSWLLGTLVALIIGAGAGVLTGVVYALNPRGPFKLLASVLVLFAGYSINFRLLGGQPNRGFISSHHFLNDLFRIEMQHGWTPLRPLSLLVVYLVCGGVVLFTYALLNSPVGGYLRMAGHRPEVLRCSGREPIFGVVTALLVANALVALGGSIKGALGNYADINFPGTVLHVLAALLLGEFVIGIVGLSRGGRKLTQRGTGAVAIVSVVVGSLFYTTLKGLTIALLSRPDNGQVEASRSFSQSDQNLVIASCIVAIIGLNRLLAVRNHRLEDPEDAI